MNKKRALWNIWFIPLVSLIVQVLLVYFIDKMIPYKIEDVKGEQAFWIIYSFYAITILIVRYIYIGLVRRYKKPLFYYLCYFNNNISININFSFLRSLRARFCINLVNYFCNTALLLLAFSSWGKKMLKSMYRLLILIFLGSVFLTSEKFVDTTNTVKFYFTVLATLFFIILIVLNKEIEIRDQKLGLFNNIKGVYIVGVIQAFYGILQFVGIFTSNHHKFSITGSFDNPAGFSSILALLFPIGLYWCIKSKKQEQILVSFFLGLVLLAVVLSGSRAGLLSIIISSTILLSFEFCLGEKIKALKRHKQIIIIVFSLILHLH